MLTPEAEDVIRVALRWENPSRMRLALETIKTAHGRILTNDDAELTARVEFLREDWQSLAPIWSQLGFVAVHVENP